MIFMPVGWEFIGYRIEKDLVYYNKGIRLDYEKWNIIKISNFDAISNVV